MEPNRSTFVIITSDENVDKLLSNSMRDKFRRDDFEILTPPEHTANRTFVLRNIDSLITTIDIDELKSDIESRNTWLKVNEIIKIPNAPKILKIQAENTEMVRKATESGILIYNQSIPATSVEKEIFVNLIPCYKCYAYTHKTQDCETPNLVVCSECSSTTHTYKDCRSQQKRCINCDGDHRTMAAKCPVRRELIKQRSKEMRERSRSRSRPRYNTESTYAQVTKGNQGTESTYNIGNRDDYVKIVSSITYAQAIENVLPGSFHMNVQEMYRINNLPRVNFPNYIPPANIDASGIKEELQKLKAAFDQARRAEQNKGNRDNGSQEMETESESRKRTLPSPTTREEERPKSKPRTEEENNEEEELEGAVAWQQSSSNQSSSNPTEEESNLSMVVETSTTQKQKEKPQRKANIETNVEGEEQKRKSHLKQARDMKFCLVTTKETAIKRADYDEIDTLIKEGKIKYVYSNPNYKEVDCRRIWESRILDIKQTDIKIVPKDFYMSIEYNGRYIKERRTSISSDAPKR